MRRLMIASSLLLGAAAAAVAACSDSEPGRAVTGVDSGFPDFDSGVTPGPDGSTPAPVQELTGDAPVQGGTKISANRTLSKDKTWLMKGVVYVPSGVTLTIEKGTTIKGDKATLATLVVQPGGKIMAEGTADEPIVFTSLAKEGQRQAGDWGGVILLGKAPVNGGRAADGGLSSEAYIEGLVVTPENRYGGADANDNSGVMKYVRIEYSGVKIGADNEINGLTFGGVGAGTTIDHIFVRHTLDDCFEFFGGTVNAKYLACAYNQDDGFDWDNGFSGKLQFLIQQQDAKFDDEMNGFEADNDALGSDATPNSNPTIYNATLCGQSNFAGAKRKFGMLLRRNTAATIRNVLAWGYDAALDVRDAKTHARANGTSSPALTVQNSWFFKFSAQNLVDGLGLPETKPAEQGFNEAAWIKDAANSNVTDVDPAFDCMNQESPNFAPSAPQTEKAAAPPADGFFEPNAKYIGAVKDGTDKWYTAGKWAAWTKPGF